MTLAQKTFTLLSLSLLLSFVPLLTQSDELLITPSKLSKELAVNTLDPEFEDITTVQLTNLGSTSLQLQWAKVIESQPAGWEILVCSKQPGFSPYSLNTDLPTDDQEPFRLAAGASTEFYLILRPNNKSGKGRISLNFSKLTQPGRIMASAVFDMSVINRGQNQTVSAGSRSLRVYPNPAVNNFFVELPRNVKAGKVEVFNTLGRKLKSFPRPDNEKGYEIDDLPEGIYLINIYDDEGTKLKTLRLFHRRFGA